MKKYLIWLTISLAATFFMLYLALLGMSGASFAIINNHPRLGYFNSYRRELQRIKMAFELYALDNGGLIPPTKDPNDYYYWVEGIRPYLGSKADLYCSMDKSQKYPSSYISDPGLAGKNLEDILKIPNLVLIRERDFRHLDHKAAFVINDYYRNLTKEEIPKDVKCLFISFRFLQHSGFCCFCSLYI